MNLTPVLRQRFFDDNGDPLAGGLLYSYIAGTTTPQVTYTDAVGDPGSENDNPIELDANGECDLWMDPTLSYKFILADADDVPIWTVDGVIGIVEDEAVPTAAIQDDAVTADKLRDSVSIDADRAVTTNHIRLNAVTNSRLAQMATMTIKGNNTGGAADPIDLTATQVRSIIYAAPTFSSVGPGSHNGGFSANGTGTYTTPSGVKWIRVRLVGGGGGGAGSGTGSGSAAGTGGTTYFRVGASPDLLVSTGGAGGAWAGNGGAGGTASIGTASGLNFTGSAGNPGGGGPGIGSTAFNSGGVGGCSALGGSGRGGWAGTAGANGAANTGSGGGGGGGSTSVNDTYSGSGGGAAGFVDAVIAPSALQQFAYSVGDSGTAGGAGTSGLAGGAGAAGVIIVEEHYL